MGLGVSQTWVQILDPSQSSLLTLGKLLNPLSFSFQI